MPNIAGFQPGWEPMAEVPPIPQAYAAFFLGQFGWLFSSAFAEIGEQTRALGFEVDIVPWSSYADIAKTAYARHLDGYKVALCGYSLGARSAMWVQTLIPCDLLLCVAASTLAETYPISKTTARSILWPGTDFLSSAGQRGLGFTEIEKPVQAGWGIPVLSHVLLPATDTVTTGVLAELAKLKGN
jgi:hypothetical protein